MGRGKQLNIYVPMEKLDAVERLRRLSKSTGKPINWLVVDAITQYLNKESPSNAEFRSFELKVKSRVRREEIYEEQLERKLDRR
jgi:predicted DNA-binding protein